MTHNIIETFYHDYFQAHSKNKNAVMQRYVKNDVIWHVAHPLNHLHNKNAIQEKFLEVFQTALPDIERRPFIVVDGQYQGRHWYNSTGYFSGTFSEDLLQIPATHKTLYVRYTEMVCVEDQKISEYYLILDFIDVMNQAGVNPLRKSLGHDGLIMPPMTSDGCYCNLMCEQESQKSQLLVQDMLGCLGRFDGKNLYSMDLENYWHPDFMWYGPAGIGTTRGISGFRNHHQAPFVFAFPDRSVDIELNMLAKNHYVATGGWPHMHGTHTGHSGWLGLAPTGKAVEMRVMDIWRREGDLLKENWVGIDIIHIFMQLGFDVFKQMEEQLGVLNYA